MSTSIVHLYLTHFPCKLFFSCTYNIPQIFSSDNLRFGLQFSRKFVDGSEPSRPNNFKTTKQKRIWSNRLKMNLHNNEVGRQVSNNCVLKML